MITRTHERNGTFSTAVYSDCEAYRYALTREWSASGGRIAFVMLNPSTASELRNDPTIEGCERRARQMGAGAFQVVNLFAYRATDPRDLKAANAPLGPENDAVLRQAAEWADQVICGWGVHGAHQGRGPAVEAMLREGGVDLYHLGLSKDGHPRHPLYRPYRQQPELWCPAP